MDNLSAWIQETMQLAVDTQYKLAKSFIIIILLWIITWVLLHIINKRTEKNIVSRHQWRKTVRHTALIIGVLLVGQVWIKEFKSVATVIGLFSAGLAIALKDLLINMAGWVFIVWRKPFTMGDRIQIGDTSGDVIDIRIFQFTLIEIGNWVDADQSTGRLVHVPNARIFNVPQANFTTGFPYIWEEIPVLITFESNWKKAKSILLDIVSKDAEETVRMAEREIHQASKKYPIVYKTLTPTVYTSVKDSGVMLTMRFLCGSRNRRGSTQHIWEQVLEAFSKHTDIDFAYPTQRFYNNVTEGKQAGDKL